MISDGEYNSEIVLKALASLFAKRDMDFELREWSEVCLNEQAESLISTLLRQDWFVN